MDRRDIELVRALQDGEIFLTERPFNEAARRLGWTVEEVLLRARRLKDDGYIRRFCAFLAPVNSISTCSSLAVCDVSDYRADELCALISEHPSVSYCHIRPRFESFPFNIYATIRAGSDESMSLASGEVASIAAPSSCSALRIVIELKRSSPVYFPLSLDKTVP